MQNAKDTFFEVLRGRLAAVNSERTVEVRGVSRPGLVVEENELPMAMLPDCFVLGWSGATVDVDGALPLVTVGCQIRYATAGTAANGAMDRGRLLAAMDAELLAAVGQRPWNAAKSDYSALATGGAAVVRGTQIWWGPVAFGPLTVERNRLTRLATLEVMSYQEAGEL